MAKDAPKLVKLVIDDVTYDVPEGMNLVDAAKMCGVEIPVFCYHPKLGHAANCRVCLVEMGTPRSNRETGVLEMAWMPGLQTSCNKFVTDGMAIRTATDAVKEGRKGILEFLLSSHPLDCPICDKGGECPLQNLTMAYGPGTSRMYWEEKQHLGKQIPLGDLIMLDQERCIHCARCVRFEELIADDPVLGFDYRGRKQRIVTYSNPPFDSIFSGNTTDICPVGALTSADFRFNARPWEMQPVATLDSFSPEGANMTFDTRVDRLAGGRTTIKRIMPRQNEAVNEIWISDKARFGRHYMEHPDRLKKPLMRKGGVLVEVEWEEALTEAARYLGEAGPAVAAIGGPRLSNEDAFALARFVRGRGSNHLAAFPAHMGGADTAAVVGVGAGTNLQDLGKGDAIIVAASDLHEEAPIWWLRVKAAAQRGANLIVMSGRRTRLDKFASTVIRYPYGGEVDAFNENPQVVSALKDASNAVIFVGSDGIGSDSVKQMAAAAGNMLSASGHTGRANNGLILVWPGANIQGLFDMGVSSQWGPGYAALAEKGYDYTGILKSLEDGDLKVLIVNGADPALADYEAEDALRATSALIVVMDMFLTETGQLADIVLPTQSIAERDGTFTSGERRVQRFYQAIEPTGQSLPDYEIIRLLSIALGATLPQWTAGALFKEITAAVPAYEGMSYIRLTASEKQSPDVGGDDLFFGGTAFTNTSGTGKQWASGAERGQKWQAAGVEAADSPPPGEGQLLAVPVTVLYDREEAFYRSAIMHEHVPEPYAGINPADASRLRLEEGDALTLTIGEREFTLKTRIDPDAPHGVALFPRRLAPGGGPRAAVPASVVKREMSEA